MKIMEDNSYMVTGLDLSSEMLSIAQCRVKGRLVQLDLRDIRLDDRFDAVVCLGSSFTYMQRDEDVKQALSGFHAHLNEGGVLLFDSFDITRFNLDRFGKWETETQEFKEVTITRSTRSSNWDHDTDTWTVEWKWIITDEHGVREINDQSQLKAFRIEYLQRKLAEAEFSDVELLESRRMLMKAKKRG